LYSVFSRSISTTAQEEHQKQYAFTFSKLQQTMQTLELLQKELSTAKLVLTELKDLKDDHKTYSNIGRAFIFKSVPSLRNQLVKNVDFLTEEIKKSSDFRDILIKKLNQLLESGRT